MSWAVSGLAGDVSWAPPTWGRHKLSSAMPGGRCELNSTVLGGEMGAEQPQDKGETHLPTIRALLSLHLPQSLHCIACAPPPPPPGMGGEWELTKSCAAWAAAGLRGWGSCLSPNSAVGTESSPNPMPFNPQLLKDTAKQLSSPGWKQPCFLAAMIPTDSCTSCPLWPPAASADQKQIAPIQHLHAHS